jgi:SEC-C motif-containing protein
MLAWTDLTARAGLAMPTTLAAGDFTQALELDPAIHWSRLAVLEADGGGLFDTAGTVRFRAVYVRDGERGVLDETSSFVRQDGQWSYVGPLS